MRVTVRLPAGQLGPPLSVFPSLFPFHQWSALDLGAGPASWGLELRFWRSPKRWMQSCRAAMIGETSKGNLPKRLSATERIG